MEDISNKRTASAETNLNNSILKNHFTYKIVVPISFILVLLSTLYFGLDTKEPNKTNLACYLIIFTLATASIKYKDIFAALVQPPLVIFVVTILYVMHKEGTFYLLSRKISISLIPILANQFIAMLVSTLLACCVYLIRRYQKW